MKIAAFVPIKLNSQRLENKMLLPIGDKLMCQHIFYALLNVKKEIEMDIYCYCSDEKIKDFLPKGVEFLERDKKLDSNETLGIDIYTSFINKVDADIYALCHATSPFIKETSIITGLNKIINEGHDSSCSVSRVQTFCWYGGKTLNYQLDNVVRTQDITPIFWETSAFYIFKKDILAVHKRRIGKNPYLVETDRIESIDIDEREDYELACKIVK
jgi:CMP-N-acetylneuraminic acid synthetase